MDTVSFPGLGLEFHVNRVAFSIGDFNIAWYGILIAAGLLLALIYCMVRAKQFNIAVDDLCDAMVFSLLFGVVGARLYYCIFYVDAWGQNPFFSNPLTIITGIRDGGLGIYGGVIAGFLTAFIFCKIKKISSGAMFDLASFGLLIGQAIGRWGNFVNQEAYGSTTNLPWRMVISAEQNPVHPCFLYESLWCVIGFIILHIYSKRRKFNGEIFLMYISWYAFGRFFIEMLRTDSLMIGNLKVSMVVAAVFFIAAMSLLIYKRIKVKEAIEEQNAEYEPLFEDTARAVDIETAKVEKEYGMSDDDEDENEDIQSNDEINNQASDDSKPESGDARTNTEEQPEKSDDVKTDKTEDNN